MKNHHSLKILLLCIVPAFLLLSCSSIVKLPVNKAFSAEKSLTAEIVDNFLLKGPPQSPVNSIKNISFPEKVLMPASGEKNSYGIKITPELELAYNTYLGGDGEKALLALKKAEQKGGSKGFLWQISFLKSQILIMMGRAADAEQELLTTSEREIAFIGNNLNSRALRGEIKVWIGDYKGAKSDFVQVLKALGNWSMPTSYSLPPSNMPQLVGATTAQLRAFTGIAGIYTLEEDYINALKWAKETEKRFNDVHYVANHLLYKNSLQVHADSYYGRALNLVFFAASHLFVHRDINAAEKLFKKAERFYQALGYASGEVNIATFKAKLFHEIGNKKLYNTYSQQAINLALKYGMTDMIWRIEVLRGKTLLQQGLIDKAEAAFRRAQTSLNDISGSLSTDQAKLRFGSGKDDIAYYLSAINKKKKNYDHLFEDLENARARAFVDMLKNRVVAQSRQSNLVSKIKLIDKDIIKQRLLNYSPGARYDDNINKEKQLILQRKNQLSILRQLDPELADVLSISSRSLQEIQKKLKKDDVLVYSLPFKNKDKINLLLITATDSKILNLNLTAEKFQNRINQFVSLTFGIENYYNRGISLEKTTINKAPPPSTEKKLSQIEIASLLSKELQLKKWQPKGTIYFVPSGSLYFLPWGALDIKTPVVVLPTGGWLLRKPHSFESNKKAIIVGNPDFGNKLPQLPGAEDEAKQLGNIYNVSPLISSNATEDNIRSEIGKGIQSFHLATHAFYDINNPLESAVFLSKDGKAHPLTAREIFENPISAKLVVLSACETGVVKVGAGDDFLGLARSFYIGGTLSMLTSLWPVDDEGTRLFMKVFHETAQDGDLGKAWLTARNHLKKLNYSPLIYSAFILGGTDKIF
jgi:CHAT domain-containing protein